MMLAAVSVALVLVVVVILLWTRRSRDRRLPPNLSGWLPIVGHMFQFSGDVRVKMRKWTAQHGNIFSMYLGGSPAVVLSGYDLLKEALVRQADLFSDRPQYYMNEVVDMHNTGIIFSSGVTWREQRAVCVSILRKSGMGTNLLARRIQDEVGCFREHLANLRGKPTGVQVLLNLSATNVILSILIGHRFEYHDGEFEELVRQLNELTSSLVNGSVLNFIPWLKYVPGDPFKAKHVYAIMRAIFDKIYRLIHDNCRKEIDFDEANNFIEAYTTEQIKKAHDGTSTSLNEKNLGKAMFDLLIAAADTVGVTISWLILYLLHHPEVQEKAFQEIKEVVGADRAPTMDDSPSLIYLNAVIYETQRLADVAPFGVNHDTSENAILAGYHIPKGTQIFTNLDSVLHDPIIWGQDAMTFRPGRFINSHGKLKVPEQFIPFGIGRRICMGESMAKMELFLFVSSLIQRFQFLPADPTRIPTLEYTFGNVVHPKPYDVIFQERL